MYIQRTASQLRRNLFSDYMVNFFVVVLYTKEAYRFASISMRPVALGAASPQDLLRHAEFCGSHDYCPHLAAQE